MTSFPFRLLPKQATGSKAKQALMIASGELDAFTYREGYQLNDSTQRAALERTLRSEFNVTIPLPDIEMIKKKGTNPPVWEPRSMVSYLIIIQGLPVLVPEEDVLPFVLATVLSQAGPDAARRVSYRADMLPADES